MDPGYLESLSPASVISLAIQGGPLDAAGCEAFSLHPAAEDAFRLRTYDDQGKIEDLEVPKFEHYRSMLQGLAK
jgi:predicted HD phosphohydrolase